MLISPNSVLHSLSVDEKWRLIEVKPRAQGHTDKEQSQSLNPDLSDSKTRYWAVQLHAIHVAPELAEI